MWSCHYAQTAQQKREQRAQITHRRIFAASKNPHEKKESVCTGTWCIVVVVLNKESSQNIL